MQYLQLGIFASRPSPHRLRGRRLFLAGKDGGAAFLVLQAAFYGFYAGIVVGMIACWRVCRSRLRRVPTE